MTPWVTPWACPALPCKLEQCVLTSSLAPLTSAPACPASSLRSISFSLVCGVQLVGAGSTQIKLDCKSYRKQESCAELGRAPCIGLQQCDAGPCIAAVRDNLLWRYSCGYSSSSKLHREPRCRDRPNAWRRQAAAAVAGTHHIVQLDAILETEFLKLFLSCTGSIYASEGSGKTDG